MPFGLFNSFELIKIWQGDSFVSVLVRIRMPLLRLTMLFKEIFEEGVLILIGEVEGK